MTVAVREHVQHRYKAFCIFCGAFLQESSGNSTAGVVCPICGRDLVITVKKGKVSVSEDTEQPLDPPAYRRQMRMSCYANRMSDRN